MLLLVSFPDRWKQQKKKTAQVNLEKKRGDKPTWISR